jgi:hypothetical protein
MRIEGYLFVEYGGQFRFAVDAFDAEKKIKKETVKTINFSGLLESKPMHDYLWDITMRQRPTLHELTDVTCDRSRLVKAGFDHSIYERLNRDIQKVLNAPNKPHRCKLGNGYVEFAYVPGT